MPAIISSISDSTKIEFADRTYPSTGTIGYLVLLTGTGEASSALVSIDVAASTITYANPHLLVTGNRVMFTASTLFAPVQPNVVYFAIVTSPTTIKIATTDAFALSGTAINITSAGVEPISAIEQDLNSSDRLEVLINDEVVNDGYERIPISDVGQATIVGTGGEKPPKTVTITNNGTTQFEYKYYLIIWGGNSTTGSTTGVTGFTFGQESNSVTVLPTQVKSVVIKMRVRSLNSQ